MINDLIALTPPLIMAGAVLIGVAWFLRSQMRIDPHRNGRDYADDIPDDITECPGDTAGDRPSGVDGSHFEPNSDQDGRR